jgi:hypothetical protein
MALFAAAAVFVLIGIDAWLCIRTLTPDALDRSAFNPLIISAKGSPISHGYLLMSD